MIGNFCDVKEVTSNKFAESFLGKKAEGSNFEKFMVGGDQPLAVICDIYKCCPIENGEWTDERGNSKTYMLYGHIHNSREQALVDNFINITRQTRIDPNSDKDLRYIPCQMINCFCMYSDYQPLSLMEWIENDIKRKKPDNI